MFGLGIWELLIILVVVVLIFGKNRLIELGGALGETVAEIKKIPVNRSAGKPEAETPTVQSDDEVAPRAAASEAAGEAGGEDRPANFAEEILPEIKHVRKLKEGADKLRSLRRFTRFRF